MGKFRTEHFAQTTTGNNYADLDKAVVNITQLNSRQHTGAAFTNSWFIFITTN